jgi:hypothetical protein
VTQPIAKATLICCQCTTPMQSLGEWPFQSLTEGTHHSADIKTAYKWHCPNCGITIACEVVKELT